MNRLLSFRSLLVLASVPVALLVPPAAFASESASESASEDPRLTQRIELPDLPESVQWDRNPLFIEPTSTSGLPVRVSTDPASTTCFGLDSDAVPFVIVTVNMPGTCILNFDQAGDDQFQPAERVTHTIEVTRQDSFVIAAKAGKAVFGLSPTTFRAEVDVVSWFGPSRVVWGHPGALVRFSVGGKEVCSATAVLVPNDNPFDRTAVATCRAAIGLNAALTKKSYTATFPGDANYLPATATGRLAP